MNFPPTFKQLRYLNALERHLHFGKAAEACHVTQSTLSAGIQELETLLGLTLVERTKRSVIFTATGLDIARRAKAILEAVDDLMANATIASRPFSGLVRLGIIPTIAPFLLPKIMPSIMAALPDLELHLTEEKSFDLCHRLKDGTLDCLLYALPYQCSELSEMPLFSDGFVAAFPKGKAPAALIHSQSLKKERLMLLEEGHCLRDHALDACQLLGQGGDVKMAFSGTSLHTILEMVASGQGMTLLPQMAIDAGIVDKNRVDLAHFSDIAPMRTIGLVWRSANPRAQIFTRLGEVIKTACLSTPLIA